MYVYHDDKSSVNMTSGLYKYDVITHSAPSDLFVPVMYIQNYRRQYMLDVVCQISRVRYATRLSFLMLIIEIDI